MFLIRLRVGTKRKCIYIIFFSLFFFLSIDFCCLLMLPAKTYTKSHWILKIHLSYIQHNRWHYWFEPLRGLQRNYMLHPAHRARPRDGLSGFRCIAFLNDCIIYYTCSVLTNCAERDPCEVRRITRWVARSARQNQIIPRSDRESSSGTAIIRKLC